MKAIRLMAAAFAFAALAGCVTPQPPQTRMFFPVSEYEALPRAGTGVVEGQVFMKTVGGDVKYGAGSEVLLNPVTSYSEEWYRATFIQNVPLSPADTRQDQYIRTTQADGNGNFRFADVPPGEYYVLSDVYWQAPTQFGMSTQGGLVAKRISVENDQTARVIVTP